ncbi:MAG: VWA domain-containing protein [Flavobacteriaceae bacterium]|jgi:Ca-activated chloride channel family protein|nr:VWA domain-containing protein [Flavobacteriaceae bacterium]
MNWEFEKISYIFWLLLLPFLVWRVFVLYRWKKQKISQFADISLQKRIFRDVGLKKFVRNNILILCAFGLIVFGLINLLAGIEKKEVKREGIDMVFAIDVSNSMNAQDVAPSRMEKAKKIIDDIIGKLGGDRVGIVIFAGRAYSVMPLSNDYGAAELYLQNIGTQLITAQGTNVAAAVSEAANMLSQNNSTSKAIVLISDGEAHEGNISEAVDLAENKHITIYCVGVGTLQGAPIPMENDFGYSDYKKDQNGEVVLSKLEDNSLKKLASYTGGSYFYGGSSEEISTAVVHATSFLNKKEQSTSIAYDSKQFFQFFVGGALILLIIVSLTNYKHDFNI